MEVIIGIRCPHNNHHHHNLLPIFSSNSNLSYHLHHTRTLVSRGCNITLSIWDIMAINKILISGLLHSSHHHHSSSSNNNNFLSLLIPAPTDPISIREINFSQNQKIQNTKKLNWLLIYILLNPILSLLFVLIFN